MHQHICMQIHTKRNGWKNRCSNTSIACKRPYGHTRIEIQPVNRSTLVQLPCQIFRIQFPLQTKVCSAHQCILMMGNGHLQPPRIHRCCVEAVHWNQWQAAGCTDLNLHYKVHIHAGPMHGSGRRQTAFWFLHWTRMHIQSRKGVEVHAAGCLSFISTSCSYRTPVNPGRLKTTLRMGIWIGTPMWMSPQCLLSKLSYRQVAKCTFAIHIYLFYLWIWLQAPSGLLVLEAP